MVDTEQMFVYLNFAESACCKHSRWDAKRTSDKSDKVDRPDCGGPLNISVKSLDFNFKCSLCRNMF